MRPSASTTRSGLPQRCCSVRRRQRWRSRRTASRSLLAQTLQAAGRCAFNTAALAHLHLGARPAVLRARWRRAPGDRVTRRLRPGVPLLALTVVYFTLNSGLDRHRGRPRQRGTRRFAIWKRHFRWLWVGYLGAASVAFCLDPAAPAGKPDGGRHGVCRCLLFST